MRSHLSRVQRQNSDIIVRMSEVVAEIILLNMSSTTRINNVLPPLNLQRLFCMSTRYISFVPSLCHGLFVDEGGINDATKFFTYSVVQSMGTSTFAFRQCAIHDSVVIFLVYTSPIEIFSSSLPLSGLITVLSDAILLDLIFIQ